MEPALTCDDRSRPVPRSSAWTSAGRVALAAAAILALAASPASGQVADTAAEDSSARERDRTGPREGPPRIGAFVYLERDGARMLVTPDTSSSLDEGARLFLRCGDGRRELFVALAGGEAGLGNANQGAAGQFRIDRSPWTDLEQWGANEAGTAAFMAPGRIPTFLGRAKDGDRAEIRIVNPAGVRHRYVFRTESLVEALERLPCMGGR